jgi:tetratricopeptide (TPR) repeat protein
LLADGDYDVGRRALKAGDLKSALRRFQAALKRYPEAADLRNELGFTHRKLGQMDKAFEHYKRARAVKPEHEDLRKVIAAHRAQPQAR